MNDRMKELDSVRGIAVLLVIAYHVFKRGGYFTKNALLHFIVSLSSIGWVGVDIFFALSGFLITSILLKTKTGEHYFKNFYARRVLRIVPAYLLLILGVFFFVPEIEPDALRDLPRALPILALFQQNWAFIFSNVKITSYLQVTWSLAVEEQFYFIWPLIVYKLRRETLLKFGAIYIALSILARIAGLALFTDAGNASIYVFFYYNSLTRFEQLIIGAMLATLLTYDGLKDSLRRYAIPSFLFFLACFLALALLSPIEPHPAFGYPPMTIVGYTSAALCTAGLIAAFSTYPETAPIRRLFQNKLLAFFGKYSYALYLFHMPAAMLILDFLWHTGARGWQMYFAYIIATFAVTNVLALLSWNLIEKHALSLKTYFEY